MGIQSADTAVDMDMELRSRMMRRGMTRSLLVEADETHCDTVKLKRMSVVAMHDLTPNKLKRKEVCWQDGGKRMDEVDCHTALTDDDALSQGHYMRNMTPRTHCMNSSSSSSHFLP